MSFQLKGAKEMERRLQRIAAKFPDKIMGALRVEAELIKTDSQQNYVPVDLGTLRSSAQVSDVERKGKDVEVSISYGGAASDYALAIHEHTSEHSPPSWQGTDVQFSPQGRGPKYLEKPLMAAVRDMDGRIAARIRADLEKEEAK